MKLRTMTNEDFEYASNHSVSRSVANKEPPIIDWAVTIEEDGKVMAVGGIRMINLTTAWVWIDLTCNSGSYMIGVYRLIRDWLDGIMEEHGLFRLQAYVESDFEEAIRMVDHLGFEYESTMEKFVDDKPAYLYARFREDK
jgi:RimJ/RimL family protein N-acetyltransferase